MIFLDTNIVIGFLGRERAIRARFEAAQERGDQILVSAIVRFELEYGAALSRRPADNRSALEAFFAHVFIAPFTPEAAVAAGRIRSQLRKGGTPIGPYDVLIAGHALAEDAVLITHNTREFSRIPGLKLDDWLTP